MFKKILKKKQTKQSPNLALLGLADFPSRCVVGTEARA